MVLASLKDAATFLAGTDSTEPSVDRRAKTTLPVAVLPNSTVRKGQKQPGKIVFQTARRKEAGGNGYKRDPGAGQWHTHEIPSHLQKQQTDVEAVCETPLPLLGAV